MKRALPLVIVLCACGPGVLSHPAALERGSAAEDAGEHAHDDSPLSPSDSGSDDADDDAAPRHSDDDAAPGDDGGTDGSDGQEQAERDAALPPELEPAEDAGADAAPLGPRLDLSVDGPGHVESAALDCDGTHEGCGAHLATGTMLTLTAVPTGDALFGGWTGACTGQDETCELTLTEAQSVRVTFIPRYSLNVVIVGDISCQGTGNGFVNSNLGAISCRTSGGVVDTTSCSARLLRGTEIELTAYPQEATVFQGYGGGCTSSERTCTLRVDDDITVNALFCGLIH